jgi:hypothetical protein
MAVPVTPVTIDAAQVSPKTVAVTRLFAASSRKPPNSTSGLTTSGTSAAVSCRSTTAG